MQHFLADRCESCILSCKIYQFNTQTVSMKNLKSFFNICFQLSFNMSNLSYNVEINLYQSTKVTYITMSVARILFDII